MYELNSFLCTIIVSYDISSFVVQFSRSNFATRSADSFVIISPYSSFVNTFFEVFQKFFWMISASLFWGSLSSLTQWNSFVKYFFKLFSSFFFAMFQSVLSCDSLTILSLWFWFVKTFFDIFFVLVFYCSYNKSQDYDLCSFANNRFTTLKKQSVFRLWNSCFAIPCVTSAILFTKPPTDCSVSSTFLLSPFQQLYEQVHIYY